MLLAACLLITHSKQLKVMTKSFWPNSEGYPTLFKNSFVSYYPQKLCLNRHTVLTFKVTKPVI